MTFRPSIKRHEIVTLKELDDSVHQVQLWALEKGMIPISCIISRPLGDGRHEILGFGHNELTDGIPGIHGETGAIINMGRISGGYENLVATSSLSPCPFCQCTLAKQMGIKQIRILDDKNYLPDKSDYEQAGIAPEILSHPKIEQTFNDWVNDPKNEVLWNRDIGIPFGQKEKPYQFTPEELNSLMGRAERLASEAVIQGEPPIGALIVDEFGQVVGSGFPRISLDNDPSKVAAMTAWRAAGSRNDWGRYTLVLTCGPDHIAYSMFKVFDFGQLIIGNTKVYAGQTEAVKALGKTTVIMNTADASDQLLKKWLSNSPKALIKEYLGADWSC